MKKYFLVFLVGTYLFLSTFMLRADLPVALFFLPGMLAMVHILLPLPGSMQWAFGNDGFYIPLSLSFLGWLVVNIIILVPIFILNWLIVKYVLKK